MSVGAVWKAELLIAAGAIVQVHAVEQSPALARLALSAPPEQLLVTSRPWDANDLSGAGAAIGDFENDAEAAAFAAAVRASGVLVNVIDKPEFCDFQFGALVNRSPLVIAISTDGAAPVFGQALRARIEMLLPKGFTRWAETAKTWRGRFQQSSPDFRARRRFWEQFSERALASPDRSPIEGDYDACLAASRIDEAETAFGRVALMRFDRGAEPSTVVDGMTVLAVRRLGAADVVVHDDATPSAILEFGRREAQRLAVDPAGGDATEIVVDCVKRGLQVVRVMCGTVVELDAAALAIAHAVGRSATVEVVSTIGQPASSPRST